MSYHIELSERAIRDLDAIHQRIISFDSYAAIKWFNGLESAVLTLEQFPGRCPVAPESKKNGRTLRHLLYGKNPDSYRVIFEVEERKKIVWVLTIRHGQMDELVLI